MCLYIRTFFPLPCMHGWSHSWTRKIMGYMGSILPSSHIIVDPMVCGTHPDVRGREHTPKVPNNNPLGNGRHTYQKIKYFSFFLYVLVFVFVLVLVVFFLFLFFFFFFFFNLNLNVTIWFSTPTFVIVVISQYVCVMIIDFIRLHYGRDLSCKILKFWIG